MFHGRDGGRGRTSHGRFPAGRGNNREGRVNGGRNRGYSRDGWGDYCVQGGHGGGYGDGVDGGRQSRGGQQCSDGPNLRDVASGTGRRFHEDYQQRPEAVPANDVWICKECKNENLKRDGLLCVRCGKLSRGTGGPNTNPNEQRRRSPEHDYYGPGSVPPGRSDDFRHPPHREHRGGGAAVEPPKEVEWPPLFEENGGAFMFDSRCGMFYEPLSNFFYDPKTKLYFSNKKQKYFRHQPGTARAADGSSAPLFQAIESATTEQAETSGGTRNEYDKGENATEDGALVDKRAASSSVCSGLNSEYSSDPFTNNDIPRDAVPLTAETKPKIAISIGGGFVSRKLSSANEDNSTTSSREIERKDSLDAGPKKIVPVVKVVQMKKTVAKDIAKWNQKAVGAEDATASSAGAQQLPGSSKQVTSTAKEVKRTADGKPICLVCKRKFASLEKLNEHERVSALHKQNLAKQLQQQSSLKDNAATAKANEANTDETIPAPQYRDRAQERRQIFGEDVKTEKKEKVPASPSSTKTSPVPHSDSLTSNATTNIGTKMLQKLGWSNGESLGRPGGVLTKQKGTADHLKRDWERIENIANMSSGERKRQKTTTSAGLGSV